MSPELFQYFPYHYTGLQVVASGFNDTMGLFGNVGNENRGIAVQWMEIMGLSEMKAVRLAEMSASRQRLCLLARAVVKNPYLLMLGRTLPGI